MMAWMFEFLKCDIKTVMYIFLLKRQVEKGSLCSVLDCLNSRTLDDNGVEVNSSESELEMNDSLSWDLFRQDTNDENDRGKASKLQQLIAPANLLTETARVLMPPPLERDLALQRLTQQVGLCIDVATSPISNIILTCQKPHDIDIFPFHACVYITYITDSLCGFFMLQKCFLGARVIS